jgi:hypothetical protein
MASQSKLESLPVEIINNILSYLVYPRSRLPGLTERQSDRACPAQERQAAKDAYHLNYTAQPDIGRFAVDLFSWQDLHHPFNELALTSKRLRALTERFCAHLVTKCNKFNLPFAEARLNGPALVYPNLSHIVYRRLWAQTATRYCVYCNVMVDNYPYRATKTPIISCLDCFYAQVYVSNIQIYCRCYSFLSCKYSSVRPSASLKNSSTYLGSILLGTTFAVRINGF